MSNDRLLAKFLEVMTEYASFYQTEPLTPDRLLAIQSALEFAACCYSFRKTSMLSDMMIKKTEEAATKVMENWIKLKDMYEKSKANTGKSCTP